MLKLTPVALGLTIALAGCGDEGGTDGSSRSGWEDLSASKVQEVCGFDPDTLDGKLSGDAWIMVRGGQACFKNRVDNDGQDYVASIAKTFGAITFGMVNMDTDNGISPDDMASDWIDRGYSGSDAKLYHILSMSSHTRGLDRFSYDTVGTTQINDLSDALNKAIKEYDLADGLDDYVHNTVMPRLGMENSRWSPGNDNKIFAFSLYSSVGDLARFGEMINKGGVFQGERYMTKEWTHRQTHPANEEANGGYGLLTWLNAPSWKDIAGTKRSPDLDCAPVVLRQDDFGADGVPKSGKKDVGVWLSRGVGGHFLIGHPGLDMVMAIKDYSGRPNNFWNAVLPAMVEASGLSEREFCNAYEDNEYEAK